MTAFVPYNYLININNIKTSITSGSTIILYTNDIVSFTPIISNTYYITSNLPFCENGISNGIVSGTISSAYENNNYNIEISYFNQNILYLWSVTINVLHPSTKIQNQIYNTYIDYDQNDNIFINLYINESFMLRPNKIDNYTQTISTATKPNSNISINNDGFITGYFTVHGSYVIHLDYYTVLGKSTIVFQFIIYPKIIKINNDNNYNCSITVNSNIAVDYPSSIINLHSLDKIIINPNPIITNSNIYFDVLSPLNIKNNIEYNIPNFGINNVIKPIKILYCDINGLIHIWDSLLNIIPYKTHPQTEYVCLININDTMFHIYNNKSIIDVKYNNIITFYPIPIIQNLTNKYIIISNIPSNYINYNNKTITCPKITTKYKLDIIYYDSNNIKYSWRTILNIISN
jgi:hypothetical protein